jgi:signal peptidase I
LELFSLNQRHNQYFSQTIKLTRESIKQGNTVHLRIISDSMRPFMVPGDIIHMSAVIPEALRRGDIIIYIKGEELYTHRLLNINKYGYYTKGDSSTKLDDIVSFENLLGVVHEIDKGGHIINLNTKALKTYNQLLGWLEFNKVQTDQRYKDIKIDILSKNRIPQILILFYYWLESKIDWILLKFVISLFIIIDR